MVREHEKGLVKDVEEREEIEKRGERKNGRWCSGMWQG